MKEKTVLCVDDDPSVLSALRRLLRSEPYELVTVQSPQLALEWIEKGGVSLVLVDQRMPEMCGSDFAVLEEELQPVLKALRKAGINIVAIHQHMTGETPRILFLHYWGRGKAVDVARGIRAALDTQTAKQEAK